jgi:prepilin-type N-terminal cleavage/methylation domain-containing protein
MSRGFTLTEMTVVLAISSILLVALMRFFSSGYPLSRVVFEQASATETARVQLRRLVRTLREARESDTGAYPLVVAEEQRLIFYADVDDDEVTERIRYELSGSDLERGIIEPGGDPLAYQSSDEETSVVAAGIRNGGQPVFIYYSGDYPADTTELTPADLTEVKYVAFRLLVDTNPTADPPPIEIASHVHLRNLKTNLAEDVENEE